MTCSLALDHGVHPPPLCAANKAKTDVATPVWFGVDVCYTEQVTMYIPRRSLLTHAALSKKDAAFVCEVGREGRDDSGAAAYVKPSPIPLPFLALVLSHHEPANFLLLTLCKLEKQKSILSFRGN